MGCDGPRHAVPPSVPPFEELDVDLGPEDPRESHTDDDAADVAERELAAGHLTGTRDHDRGGDQQDGNVVTKCQVRHCTLLTHIISHNIGKCQATQKNHISMAFSENQILNQISPEIASRKINTRTIKIRTQANDHLV